MLVKLLRIVLPDENQKKYLLHEKISSYNDMVRSLDVIFEDIQYIQQHQMIPYNIIGMKSDLGEIKSVYLLVRYLSEHILLRPSADPGQQVSSNTIYINNHTFDMFTLFKRAEMSFEAYHHHVGVHTNNSTILKTRNIDKKRLLTCMNMMHINTIIFEMTMHKHLKDFSEYRAKMKEASLKYLEAIAELRKDIHSLSGLYSDLRSSVRPEILQSQRSLYRTEHIDKLNTMYSILQNLFDTLYPMNIISLTEEYSSLEPTFLLNEVKLNKDRRDRVESNKTKPESTTKDRTVDLNAETEAFSKNIDRSLSLQNRSEPLDPTTNTTLESLITAHKSKTVRLKSLKERLKSVLLTQNNPNLVSKARGS